MKYNIIDEYKNKVGNINIEHIKELTKDITFKPNSIKCNKNILYEPIFYQHDEEENKIIQNPNIIYNNIKKQQNKNKAHLMLCFLIYHYPIFFYIFIIK